MLFEIVGITFMIAFGGGMVAGWQWHRYVARWDLRDYLEEYSDATEEAMGGRIAH